jgi:hypothetical protein
MKYSVVITHSNNDSLIIIFPLTSPPENKKIYGDLLEYVHCTYAFTGIISIKDPTVIRSYFSRRIFGQRNASFSSPGPRVSSFLIGIGQSAASVFKNE